MIDHHVDATLRARTRRERYAPPSEERALSMAEAYAVQDRVREALVARGGRVIGWKAGFTGKMAQEMFQCPEPVSAFLLDSGVYADRAEGLLVHAMRACHDLLDRAAHVHRR